MRPLPGADGEPVNWLNYKTGVKDIYFRMDVNKMAARIAIEMRQPGAAEQEEHFNKFTGVKTIFNEVVPGSWDWQLHTLDDDGKLVSRVAASLENVNILNTGDWAAIISFLKPRIKALDEFWYLVKDHF
jgi:hypothetical protein